MTNAIYHELLTRIRNAFPVPVSDRMHDAYFVFSIMRALDQADAMKSEVPLLGRPRELDYTSTEQAELAEEGRSVEEVTSLLVDKLEGLPILGHPRTQINVIPPSSIPSIIGSLLSAIYNPNLVSDDTSYGLALTEASVAAMVARLIGYDAEQSDGVFTFGGTGTMLYGIKLGIEKAFPDAMGNGIRADGVILASAQSHYCRLNVAGWLGLGEKNVVEVPTHLQNDIRIDRLDAAARAAIDQGRRIVALVATMGTTDAFGVDNLDAVVDLRDRLVDDYDLDYTPHVHADAVIGWAWSVFNGYDFERNPLGFRPRTVRALAAACRRISKLHRADSIGVDFHKTGFAPYISSLVLVRDRADLQYLVRGRKEMPYLFQSGERHPGMFTLEASRSGSGVLQRTLTSISSAGSASAFSSATLWRWPNHCASISKGMIRRRCSTTTASERSRCFGFIPTGSIRGPLRTASVPIRTPGKSCCATTTIIADCSDISTTGPCVAKACTSR